MRTRKQDEEHARLAKNTFAAVQNLNRNLCALSSQKMLDHKEAELLRIANKASRSLLRPLDQETRIPPMFKVDLVLNSRGQFFIAEVDVYNPRGLGYAVLLEKSLLGLPTQRRFPGMNGLRDILSSHVAPGAVLYVLISEFERYYETAFGILCEELRGHGIDAKMVRESTFSSALIKNEGALLSIPDTLDRRPGFREELISAYLSRRIQTVYPPVAYLGSKALLPYLRDEEGMSEFIPETLLVGKKRREWQGMLSSGKHHVLKAAVSSGMKAVHFSDLDPDEFKEKLSMAAALKNPSFVLQEQVAQAPTAVTVFDDEGSRIVGEYYFRVTAYVTAEGVLDVEVTGRPDRKVHGAPDCIQIPVILQ